MTDQYRATPEQWAKCEEDARLWSGAFNCILELRARVEALEARQPATEWDPQKTVAPLQELQSRHIHYQAELARLQAAAMQQPAPHASDPAPASKPPPLGLMPRWLADEKRLADVQAALQRYRDANLEPPGEWLWERQDLLDNLRRHRPAEAATVKESLTAPPAHTIAECGGPCEQDFRLCDCGLLQDLNPQRTPAPTTEAWPGGLVERVADAIVEQATSAGIVNDRPARAAIREVAAFLEAIQGQWCDSAAEVVAELVAELRQEASQ
jgi:hypothetical protein